MVVREHDFFDGRHWLARPRRRRFGIGDLMIAIAITALALAAVSPPDLSDGERLFIAAFALAFLTLLWGQWALAGMPFDRARSGLRLFVGVVSSLVALSMFICLTLLGLVFPQGAALLCGCERDHFPLVIRTCQVCFDDLDDWCHSVAHIIGPCHFQSRFARRSVDQSHDSMLPAEHPPTAF